VALGAESSTRDFAAARENTTYTTTLMLLTDTIQVL